MNIHTITEQPIGEHVARSWSKRISYRWGHELGDVSDYSVTGTGKSIRIHGPGISNVDLPDIVAQCIARAILDVSKRAAEQ